jgi:glutaredoxin
MKAIVWSKPDCPHCVSAKSLLALKGYQVEERLIGFGWNREQLFEAVPTAKSVPQIFIEEKYIGGFQDLQKHLKEG